jgi:hypothetical protein
MQEVASGIDVLNADEMEIKTLAYECDEHGKQDQKQGSLWSEVKARSRNCFARAHAKRV